MQVAGGGRFLSFHPKGGATVGRGSVGGRWGQPPVTSASLHPSPRRKRSRRCALTRPGAAGAGGLRPAGLAARPRLGAARRLPDAGAALPEAEHLPLLRQAQVAAQALAPREAKRRDAEDFMGSSAREFTAVWVCS